MVKKRGSLLRLFVTGRHFSSLLFITQKYTAREYLASCVPMRADSSHIAAYAGKELTL